MTQPAPQPGPHRDAYTRSRDMIAQAQREAAKAWREVEQLKRTYLETAQSRLDWMNECHRLLDEGERDRERLAALDARHQPDETGHACEGCGLTVPCPDRRILDRPTTQALLEGT